ncbi:MAG: hypothetical protein ACPGXY_02050 [Alphaproteobacteria bacterium]
MKKNSKISMDIHEDSVDSLIEQFFMHLSDSALEIHSMLPRWVQ